MLKNTILCFLFFLIFLDCGYAKAQQKKIDSLKSLIKKEKEVAQKTKLINLLGHSYEDKSDLDSAEYYFIAAKNFALENKYYIGIASFDFHAIMILNKKGKFKEAFLLAEESVEKFKQLQSPQNLGIAYINLGNQWHYFSDFQNATKYYLLAKNILDSLPNNSNKLLVNNNLGSVFLEIKEYEKAKEYFLTALELAKQNEDKKYMLMPLINLGYLYAEQNQNVQAMKYIDQHQQIAEQLNDRYNLIKGYIAKGNVAGKTNLMEGTAHLEKAIRQSKENNFPENEMNAYLSLGEIYIIHQQYQKAIENIELGIPIAEQLDTKYDLSDFHKKASYSYEHLGNFKKALQHNREYDKLISEIKLEENKNRLIGLEIEYQSKEKELKIRTLEKQRTLYIWLGVAFAVILLAALAFAFMQYRFAVSRRKLAEEKNQRLENEKQLSATQALLQGQEDERRRIAKELHDGLGGLLSGVKHNLNNMHKKLIITEEDGLSFEKSITLLDESISELRRVAHNMMPETLLKFGLDGAIKEFIQSIHNENLKIVYQSYNIENGISKQLDISTYRIIQELVNNVIKHSKATEVLIQIRKDEHLLIIDVEDNGKGFDFENISKKNGMGLAGIRSRTNYWKGNVWVESTKDLGTSVHIEIPLKII